MNSIFNTGDQVRYIGRRFARELNNKVGEVFSKIAGTKTGLVVEFGDDSYIMDERHVIKHVPTLDNTKGPEVQIKRRRKYDDDLDE